MRERLLQALSRLASVSYQEAYVVSGRSDEYAVPEDLVEDVASLCRLAQRAEFVSGFESSQLSAMLATLSAIEVHGRSLFVDRETTTATRLIREDHDWAAMRKSAAECLATFGIDAEVLRADDIDRAA